MKILQIRFKNLNSLEGEWNIDFTHPHFLSDGIFAITGPTGAGKTTILDAICLGLYGRTPRLPKMTKHHNEIMSRHTGECFAEVTFDTQKGKFRCHWSQHRARKKAQGELQSPKHELADACSGKIFDSKLRGVAEEIERVTGMDFDRFTRSVLLAQGSFAAFLQASPDERSPILEQITGTEIYSNISIQVHEKRTEVQKQLDDLKSELKDIPLLSDEETEGINGMLMEQHSQANQITQQIQQVRKASEWLDRIHRLETELIPLLALQQDLTRRQQAFQPDFQKWQRAQQALELDSSYHSLVSIRKNQQFLQLDLTKKQLQQPQQILQLEQANLQFQQAQTEVNEQKQLQHHMIEIHQKTRILDATLAAQQQNLKIHNVQRQQQEEGLQQRQDEILRDQSQLEIIKKESEQNRFFITTNQKDAGLIEQLTGIQEQFQTMIRYQKALDDLIHEQQRLETQQKFILIDVEVQQGLVALKQSDLEQQKQILQQTQQSLATILEGKDREEWNDEQNQLIRRKDTLQQLQQTAQSIAEHQHRQALAEAQQQIWDHTLEPITGQILEQIQEIERDEQESKHLQTQLILLNRIKSLEEIRHQLKQDEPCPLCGSLEHPYSKETLPTPDATEERLHQIQMDLKQKQLHLGQLKIQQIKIIKDLEQNTLHQQELSIQIELLKNHFLTESVLISSSISLENHHATLSSLLYETKERFQLVSKTRQSLMELEKQSVVLHQSVDSTQSTWNQARADLQKILHQQQLSAQSLHKTQEEVQSLRISWEQSQHQIIERIQPFQEEVLVPQTIEPVLSQLVLRCKNFKQKLQQQTKLDTQFSHLESQQKHQSSQLQKDHLAFKQQINLIDELRQQHLRLQEERITLFGEKSVDLEEQRCVDILNQLEKKKNELQQMTMHLQQNVDMLTSQIEELLISLHQQQLLCCTAEELFMESLKKHDFINEKDFIDCRLSEDQRRVLSEKITHFATEEVQLVTLTQDKNQQLEKERHEALTTESQEFLTHQLDDLLQTQKHLHEQLGRIQQQLKEQQLLKNQQQERLYLILAQEKEGARWNQLHQLIGSADGKKYRNFAQSLTFASLLDHANLQLQKMTDRYLLIQEKSALLEVHVMDNYQAGEVRSTKNLSGGESFIVSLALALGLSQMSSQKVRVDSLFLDEGFGTLDEEALDTALETLSRLRQEGKLIGIISHVAALKERISTQLRIHPQSGGRSIISGPGV